MKKKINLSVLIVILTCMVIIFIVGYRSLAVDKLEVEEMLSSSQRENEDLNNVISANDIVFEETQATLNDQLDDYETIITRWVEYDFNTETIRELLGKAYDLKVMVRTQDRTFPLPKNGIINVDSDFVELEISYKLPSILLDKELNDLLHFHDGMFNDIRFDEPDEYYEDDNTIRITYDNLDIGDKRNVFVVQEMQNYLGLSDSRIQITNTDVFQDSKDYRPINIKEKKFTGGLFRRGFTHYITYHADGSWILDTDDELTDWILMYENDNAVRIKFEYDEELKVTGVSTTELELNKHDRVVLPSKLKIGTSWETNDLMAMITAVDLSIDTGLGILDTIEVTYKENDNIAYISYFARNLGLVYRKSSLYDDNLYDVTYYK